MRGILEGGCEALPDQFEAFFWGEEAGFSISAATPARSACSNPENLTFLAEENTQSIAVTDPLCRHMPLPRGFTVFLPDESDLGHPQFKPRI